MVERVKTLQEIAQEINETLGVSKKFTPGNGFFIKKSRNIQKDYEKGLRRDTKVLRELSFQGTHQPVSFGLFKSKKGYNTKLKNKKDFANHYGEYLAYLILKQLGKKVCKVDLGEIDIPFYGEKTRNIEGCLSHFQLSMSENYLSIAEIIDYFSHTEKEKFKELTQTDIPYADKNYTNVEVILEAIEYYCQKNNQASKIPEIRKAFFDMCIFDIKFANRDRHDENFGLKVDSLTGEINFYPLFDNEQILGMQEEKSSIEKYLQDPKEYEKFKSKELTSFIGIPTKTQRISPTELLEYLLEHYYDETMDSLKDIDRYRIENLEEVLEVCPNLSEPHKELAKKIYLEREQEILHTTNEFNLKSKKIAKTDNTVPEL